ncbi:MAG: hypothetical protein PVH61_11505 [Candidatus Aminicenantes bacterium]
MRRHTITFLLVLLTFSFSIYGMKVTVLTEIRQPKNMAVDATQLYIAENATVYIYSLDDFKLIKSFGRKGQGPQEFQTFPHIPITIDVSTDKLIVSSIRKISYFTKQGEFLKEVRALSLALYLQPLGDGFLGRSHVNYNGFNHAVVNIYDAKLNKLKEVYRVKDPYQGPGKGYKVLDTVFVFRAYKDKILVPGKDDATIDVFDRDLNKLFSIHLDQKKRKLDQNTRKRLTHLMKTSPDTKDAYELIRPLSFPDYFPVIADFFVDDDTIYVMTWKKENGSNEFFTYDMQGKFKKRLLIPIKYETELTAYPTTIKKGKLYQIVENENKEEWEFHVSKIN